MYVGVIVPFTFGIIFIAQLLWVWHSMVEFTRDGARYATTHCWESGGNNVLQYMYTHVPVNVEQSQFSSANANAAANGLAVAMRKHIYRAKDAMLAALQASEEQPQSVPLPR